MTEKTLSSDLLRIKEKILAMLPDAGRIENVSGALALTRFDAPLAGSTCFYCPLVALVVQGEKRSVIGTQEINYGPGYSMAVGVDMPGVYQIQKATHEDPFLSLSIKLDRQIITELLTQSPELLTEDDTTETPIAVAEASEELLNAFLRLLNLEGDTLRCKVLGPMIVREIHYLMLTGPQGHCLRTFGAARSQAGRIAGAIAWLRTHYTELLDVPALAAHVNMAPSTFRRHFGAVTGMSPVQFQQRLRLYEAERLMLTEGAYACTAAAAVGYNSISQFSREYKRLFGASPRSSIVEKRKSASS